MTLPAGKYRLAKVPSVFINVRSSPGYKADGKTPLGIDVGDLYPGTFVELTGVASGDWLECLTADGVRGWVALQGGGVVLEAVDVPPAANANGIDVSSAQVSVDWRTAKAAGYSFGIIRATQGIATSKPVGKDTRFVKHIDAALAAEMNVGAYHAFIASVDGGKQAEFFYRTVAPYLDKLAFPLAIDVELDNGQSASTITGRLFDMASTLEALGLGIPMIYTSVGFWDAHTIARNDSYFARCPLWIAHWTDAPAPLLPRAWKGKDWRIWQWRVQDGGIPGYARRIDLNRAAP